MCNFIDLTGKQIGKWKVIQRIKKKINRTHWLCICECGFNSIVIASHLNSGKSTKCKKCHNKDAIKKRSIKHGATVNNNQSKEYQAWSSMKTRCLNKNSVHWKYYGGRGISICKEWYEFENFIKDMGQRPPNTTLDRIDVNSNYCKNNCHWATIKIQNENKRNNIFLEKNGIIKTKTQWAKDLNIPNTSFARKLKKYGWPFPESPEVPK